MKIRRPFLPLLALLVAPALAHAQAVGSEFQVNTYTTGAQIRPAVAALGTTGAFVVAWDSYGSTGTDSSAQSIQMRRFGSDGSAIGSDFQVNVLTTSYQVLPAVTALGTSGNFVVVWHTAGTGPHGRSVMGRRFASDGSPIGSDFVINTYSPSANAPVVAPTGTSGSFVVIWHGTSAGSDNSGQSVMGRRYASDGSAIGSDFQVNTVTNYTQQYASVAAVGSSGDFVVAWQSQA